jgi:hypothetical protein
MADDIPIACSLGAGELQQRLGAIEEVGARSLLSRTMQDEGHLLRFRPESGTRRQLEGIIAAEAECCSFLDLSLREDEGELVMSIAAPKDAQALADGLADAFNRRALRSCPP